MSNKSKGTSKDSNVFTKDSVGYVLNEDSTASVGIMDEAKKMFRFVKDGCIYKFNKKMDAYVLTSGYGCQEIHKGLPENEAEAIAEGVALTVTTNEKYSKLKESFLKSFWSKKTLADVEKEYNDFVRAIKHSAKKIESEDSFEPTV